MIQSQSDQPLAPQYEARFLGRAVLRRPNQRDAALTAGKPLCLIVCLYLTPGRRAGRDYLLDLLWSDRDLEAGKHLLRQAVWYARKRLGHDTFRTGDRSLELILPLESDVGRFTRAIERRDLEAAIGQYGGELLPNVSLPGARQFDKWLDTERQRLRTSFVLSAESVATERMARADFHSAAEMAERVRQADRVGQLGWRLGIQAHHLAGDYVRATLLCEEFERSLAADGREADSASQLVLAAVRQPSIARDAEPSKILSVELVGREHEFHALQTAWRETAGGSGDWVHVTSHSGFGKTRLLTDFARALGWDGGTAISLSARQGEREIPYALASELAAHLAELPGAVGIGTGSAGALVALNPSLSNRFSARPDRAEGAEALRRRSTAMREMLRAVGEDQHVAVILDDLHWADHQSLDVIRSLGARIESVRVLLVTASRPTAELLSADSQVIELSPLGVAHVEQLVECLATLPREPWAADLPERLCSATGGSPLFILEELQLALDDGRLVVEHGEWRAPQSAPFMTTTSVKDTISGRLRFLDPLAIDILRLATVAGTPLSLPQIAHATQHDEQVAEATDMLERQGWIRRVGQRIAPSHDELAAAVEDELQGGETHRIHGALARALNVDDASNQEIIRAVRHARHALEPRLVTDALGRFVRRRRRQGDRRPILRLAQDAFGPTTVAEVRAAVRTLPMRQRIRTRVVVAAAAGFAVSASASALAWRHEPRVDPAGPWVYLQTRNGAADQRFWGTPLHPADWKPSDPLVVTTPIEPLNRAATFGLLSDVARSPTGLRWLVSVNTEDGGGRDIFVTDADTMIRLTREPGDDIRPSWAPEQNRLSFITTRWRTEPGYDIAILRLDDASVVRLVPETIFADRALWNPSGTLIAYDNIPSGVATDLCVVVVDTGAVDCWPLPVREGLRSMGWASDHEIAVALRDGANTRDAILSVETGAWTESGLHPGILHVGPNAQWEFSAKGRTPRGGHTFSLRPFGRADLERGVRTIDSSIVSAVYLPTLRETTIDSATIVFGVDSVPVEISLYPSLTLHVGNGQTSRPLHRVRWHSTDSNVVRPIGGGFETRTPGVVTVFAEAIGEIQDSLTLRVVDRLFVPSPPENWSNGMTAWRSFGDPRPSLVVDDDGRSLSVNGDGNYSSGLYSSDEHPGRDGLGVEAILSTAITEDVWQAIGLELARFDEDRLLDWGHTHGSERRYVAWTLCRLDYPRGTTFGTRSSIGISQGGFAAQHQLIEVDSTLATGRWYRARLQTFPDGTCGVAIDGVPIVRTRSQAETNGSYRVVIAGSALGTRILVKRIDRWRGVRNDVDWTAVAR